jgi:hypothetical protein
VAKDLKTGYRFETADHRSTEVVSTRPWTQHLRVYNLTVDKIHTYYVIAGNTPVLVHNCDTRVAGSDLGRAHNAAALSENGHHGFSGVYDPATDAFHARQSGGPNALVDQYGGHAQINQEVFGGSRDTVGFAVMRGEDGGLQMRWNSRSVNQRNFGDRAAPMEHRDSIMDAIRRATGMEVVG